MNVDYITIKLSGKFDLEKLKECHFQTGHMKNRFIYYYDGAMHRYIFTALSEKDLEITIIKRPNGIDLPHVITFGNVNGIVKKYVERIEIKEQN